MRREPKVARKDQIPSEIPKEPKTGSKPLKGDALQGIEEQETAEDEGADSALDELEALFDNSVSSSLIRKGYKPPPPKDCQWTEWEKKGRCQSTNMGSCGVPGVQKYEREQIPAQHGGSPCVGKDEKEEDGCLLVTCSPTPGPTAGATTAAATTTMALGSRLHIGLASFMVLFSIVLYNAH